MKKVIIVAAGKIKERYLLEGIDEYLKRLKRYCDISVVEVSDVQYENTEKTITAQSDLILQRIKGYCIVLDIGGKLLSSNELSDKIDEAYMLGHDTVTFVIGGSNGVDERVKKAASLLVSFGRMTMPHQLIRLVLIEQIYRAFTITANTPYHK